jgi:hypothetical protein
MFSTSSMVAVSRNSVRTVVLVSARLAAIPDGYSGKMQAFFPDPEIGALAMVRLSDIYATR